MESSRFPTEQEQFEIYKQAGGNAEKAVTIRTLDIGGDKNLPYYQFEKEENPFLGGAPFASVWICAMCSKHS